VVYWMRIWAVVAFCSSLAAAGTPQPARVVDQNTGASYSIQDNGQPPPKEWIDKDTRHRVVRLSDEPNSSSLYFHQNAFSTDGKKMAFTSPTGIYQVDLETRNIELILGGETSQFTQGNIGARISMIVTGRKTGHIFFTKTVLQNPNDPASVEQSVWWIDPDSKVQHEIGLLPKEVNVGTVNCDETLLAGGITYLDGRGGATTRST
jgi:oligogalacturonide lyase